MISGSAEWGQFPASSSACRTMAFHLPTSKDRTLFDTRAIGMRSLLQSRTIRGHPCDVMRMLRERDRGLKSPAPALLLGAITLALGSNGCRHNTERTQSLASPPY